MNEELKSWGAGFMKLAPGVLAAILVMTIAILAGKFFRKIFYKTTMRISRKVSVSSLFSRMIQILILLLGLFVALDILQLNKAIYSMLAGAGIIGIILGFAFQDISANFIAGIYIAIKRPFDIGHTVKTNDYIGNVEEIQLRSTVIRTFSGLHLMIPNRDIIQKPMINYSLTRERRIELEFYIDSASDLSLAQRSVFAEMQKMTYLYPGKAVEIYFSDFRENAIKMAVWFWIDNHQPPGYMVARHDAIFHIMTALKAQSISLMVPVSIQQLRANP